MCAASTLCSAVASAAPAPDARAGDATTSGVILGPGAPTVVICGKPAVRTGDMTSAPPQVVPIVGGSPTVLIGGKPAARAGDATANGGRIVTGCPTVLVGP